MRSRLAAYVGSMSSAVTPAEEVTRPWRRSIIAGGWVWLASHALMALVTLVYHMPRIKDGQNPYQEVGPPVRDLVMRWHWWDSYHYHIIAEQGYGNPPQTTAFFPFYPLAARAFHLVVPGDMFYSQLAVSTICSLVVLVLLHRLVTYEFGGELASRTIFYFAAYPFAFFLNIGYNESMFLAFAIGALYAARRGRWWTAGVLAGISSGTRSAGVLLAGAILFEYLRQRGFRLRAIRFNVASVLLVPSGLGLFMIYCWSRFDDPLQFSKVQASWGRTLTPPWETLWSAARLLNDGHYLHPLHVYNVIDLTFTLAAMVVLVLAVVGPWRLRPDQMYLVLFGWLGLALMLVYPIAPPVPMTSFERYVIELIPVFMVLAKMGSNRNFERLYLMPAIGMQAIWMVMIMNRLWAG